ncbi:MAG: translational GTPase TypA, partial [FCB group bacterium]|nr:translational GTPase TypA [FCB group bacterium]
VMDNMDLERERGITISAKNTAIEYNGVKINIIDTPGHADFGGEVERGLNLVDGAMLLVDASEGPLPQTRFVVKKALEKNLRIILVINKIDRPDSRIAEVVDEVFDLFIDLDATDEQIDFPILYTIAKDGIAHAQLGDDSTTLRPLFETIIDYIQGPEGSDDHVPQFLIANLDYDAYVGQIAIGRLRNGVLKMGTNYLLAGEHKQTPNVKFSALYTFDGLRRQQVEEVVSGDIIAFAGIDNISIGDTITSIENPDLLPRIHVDEPTVSMIFYVNTSPFAGQDGKYLTSRHILARLEKEMKFNVSLQIEQLKNRADAFEVRGRGELQMAVLIETMRREGYEFMVSKPRVITKEIDGRLSEPVEKLYLDIPEEFVGVMSEKLSIRKGRMANIINHGSGRVNLEFRIPSRGLIGFRTTFMTETKGAGVMNTIMEGYAPWFGPIPQRNTGALVSDRSGKITAYASLSMEDRGELQLDVGTQVYAGMVIGERNRPGDLDVNITREKKLTNMRSANADQTVTLRKPHLLTLDEAIEFISENELVEITPENIRIRKMELDPNKRLSQARKDKRVDD